MAKRSGSSSVLADEIAGWLAEQALGNSKPFGPVRWDVPAFARDRRPRYARPCQLRRAASALPGGGAEVERGGRRYPVHAAGRQGQRRLSAQPDQACAALRVAAVPPSERAHRAARFSGAERIP